MTRGVRYGGECFRPRLPVMFDHLRSQRNKSKDSVLWKHVANKQGGEDDFKFSMKVLKTWEG